MSPASPRVLSCALLTAVSTTVLAFAVAASFGGPAAPPPAAARPACPDSPAQLAGQHIASAAGLPDLRCADLSHANFDGVDLSQQTLVGVHAEGASFRHATLGQADLSGADLRGAQFDDADLSQAELAGVDASSASFRRADLIQVRASGARLRGADLTSTDLSQATLDGVDLRDANLTDASLIQAELRDADLHGASLWWVSSIQADTSSTHLSAGQLGVVQVPYLVATAVVLLMLRRTALLLRRPSSQPAAYPNLRQLSGRLAARAAGYAVAAAIITPTVFNVAGLWIADPLIPLLVTGLIVLLATAAQQIAPGDWLRRSGGRSAR